MDELGWRERSVFLTGHTGFKGGWLSLWLHKIGAKVHGYALDPNAEPSLFHVARLAPLFASDTREDLANREQLRTALERASPEVVFHLAAQPLVRASYQDPLGTLATNVMGTANLLEAVRGIDSIRAIVIVTTDKVYANDNSGRAYREDDPLGGRDIYSASKAAAELVVSSYRSSFFSDKHAPRIATARAGNVIGGGDWARDRLIPDCLRSFAEGVPVSLRYPAAIRPWQHILEPLSGYLNLAEHLIRSDGEVFAKAWNFGPDPAGEACVGDVALAVARIWGDGATVELCSSEKNPHEAALLSLDSSQARTSLQWTPRWPLLRALQETVDWQRRWHEGGDMRAICGTQIDSYATGRSND